LVVLYADMPGFIAGIVLVGRSLRPGQSAELALILRSYAPAIAGWTYVFVLGSFLAATGATVFLVGAGVASILAGAVMMKFFSLWWGAEGIALGVSCCSLLYVAMMIFRLVGRGQKLSGMSIVQPIAIILAGAAGMHFLLVVSGGLVSPFASVPLVCLLYLLWSFANRDRLHLKEVFTT
jgi:hypothetical protein